MLVKGATGLHTLTHWGQVMHICDGKLTIIVADNGLSPGWRHAIIWTNAKILLTHWGWVAHICISKLTIIGSDNGLSPGQHQAIVNSTLGNKLKWNLNRNLYILIQENTFENVVWKWRPFCVRLNELIGPLGANFSEMLIEIYIFSFKKMHLKLPLGNRLPFCLRLNVLTH